MMQSKETPSTENDVEMTSVDDVSTQVSTAEITACPHCSFSCSSQDVLARHSWEEHPLLMRRKKHLITSRKNDDVKFDAHDKQNNHGGSSNLLTQDRTSPPVLQTAIKMEECRLSVAETQWDESLRQDNVTKDQPQVSKAIEHNRQVEQRMTSSAVPGWPSTSRSQAQQRHVAVVKPVPAQREPRSEPQQTMDTLAQSLARNKLVYAPLYNVFVPALNQYITVPIPLGTPGIPAQGFLPQNFDHFRSYAAGQSASEVREIPNQHRPFQAALPQTHTPGITLPTTWQNGQSSSSEMKPLKAVYPQQRPHAPQSAPRCTTQQDTVKSLLRRSNPNVATQIGAEYYIAEQVAGRVYTPTKTENVSGEQDGFPVAKQRKVFKPPLKLSETPIMGKEKLQALENALKMTDCCDINSTCSTMPFQCPDGVWRMVSFKCIRGVWLVQIPGYSAPIAYVPYEKPTKKPGTVQPAPSNFMPHETVRRKRKMSEPTVSEKYDLPVKRSCASAPNPSAQTENTQVPRIEHMKRVISSSLVSKGLSLPCRHFTNNEGMKVNISMIRKTPTDTSSTNLIKSLLMRKPILNETFNRMARPLSSDSMAY